MLGPPLYIVLDGAAQARGLGCTADELAGKTKRHDDG